MPYGVHQGIWLLIQWGSFWTLLWCLAETLPSSHRLVWWGLAVGLFGLGDAWRIHVERGQIHVLYAALVGAMTLSLIGDIRDRRGLLSGCLLGAEAAFRPTRVCVVLPFALAGQRRVMAGAAVGVATAWLALRIAPDAPPYDDISG